MSDKNMADVADKAVDKLTAIADAIGKIAPNAWESAVTAERANGATTLALMVVGWAIFFWCLVVFVREYRRMEKYDNSRHHDKREPAASFVTMVTYGIIGGTVGLFVLIGTACELPESVGQVAAPEAYAAHAILRAVQ